MVDILSKKVSENNDEVPQYYVEGHHGGIIDTQTTNVKHFFTAWWKKHLTAHKDFGCDSVNW